MNRTRYMLAVFLCFFLFAYPVSTVVAEGIISGGDVISGGNAVSAGNVLTMKAQPAASVVTDWTQSSFTGGEITAGKYRLAENITLTSAILIPAGAEVEIDLNGFVLSANPEKGNRVIYNQGILVIKDSHPETVHYGRLIAATTIMTNRHNVELDDETDPYYAERVLEEALWSYVGDTAQDGLVELKGGVLTGGSSVYGAGIFNHGEGAKFTLEGGTLAGNQAYRQIRTDDQASFDSPVNYGFGGGVFTQSGAEFIMNGGRICYNVADGGGGGVRVGSGGRFEMISGQIDHNHANSNGGGIDAYGSSADKAECVVGSSTDYDTLYKDSGKIPVIEYNQVYDTNLTGNGGGIHVQDAFLYYYGGTIQYNRTMGSGAGIYAYKGAEVHAESQYCVIQENETPKSGGGIMQQYGKIVLKNGIIKNNKAVSGGGINVRVGSFEMYDGIVTGNEATSNGGGILASAKNNISPHGDAGNLGCNVTIKGGEFTQNTAGTNGGGVYVSVENSTTNCEVTILGGNFSNNTAKRDGGGIYLHGGTLSIKEEEGYKTTIKENTAGRNGGAAYVATMVSNRCFEKTGDEQDYNSVENKYGYTEYTTKTTPGIIKIHAGEIAGNSGKNGGAFYVTNGEIELYGGTLKSNTASENGGAAHVAVGNVTMYDGVVSDNNATNGGAVYITGGNFTMTSGTLSSNEAVERKVGQAEAGKEGHGGAVYISGGNIVIGIKDCTQAVSKHEDGKKHPVITENKARFGGGIAVNAGTVDIYCCNIYDNRSDSDGTGMNIFMNESNTAGSEGVINHYYAGGQIGEYGEEGNDHGMVSIGGTLNVISDEDDIVTIKLIYNSSYNIDLIWQGSAPEGYYLNLPYCPTLWREEQAQENLSFIGWTQSEYTGELLPEAVRSKDHYQPIGTPVEIVDATEGQQTMNFYAVWAPTYNQIEYAYSTDGTILTDDGGMFAGYPETYVFRMGSYDTTKPDAAPYYIPNPQKAGYTFVGWKVYADKDKISNWDADVTGNIYPPTSVSQLKDPNPWTGTITENFGDITLVAIFEAAYADLKINNTVNEEEEGQSFLFRITGIPTNPSLGNIDMVVTVPDGKSTTVKSLPVGSYTVNSLSHWSWRYDTDKKEKSVILSEPDALTIVDFSNTRTKTQWLNGENRCENWWGGDAGSVVKRDIAYNVIP
ncbi:MAG: hypothetical protein E7293_06440 [Lachnospiraceae bacterium]|nr:hypothetical protein [Lachnospiraceae bacterium]